MEQKHTELMVLQVVQILQDITALGSKKLVEITEIEVTPSMEDKPKNLICNSDSLEPRLYGEGPSEKEKAKKT